MIDVLYIYKHSKNNGEELKYSLRSLEKYASGYGRMFITGDCPDFIDKSKVIHTPAQDIGYPMVNHWWKVRETIKKTDISDDFVLMYDDIFFLKPTQLTNYPYYKKGVLCESNVGGFVYQKNMLNTKEWLLDHGYTYFDYCLHIPCIYNRDKFLQLKPIIEPYKDGFESMSCRSLYGNIFLSDQPTRHDVKVRTKDDEIPFESDCFSVSDEAFNYKTLEYLREKYKNKSKFEKIS